MLKKLFITALALCIAVIAFFMYYSWSWLQSIGLPATAFQGYIYHSELAWYVLWISFTALLLLGNGILWATRSSWALWTSFIYFGVFILLKYFWLDQSAFQFKKAAGLGDAWFSFGPIFGVMIVAGAALLVILDHFVVLRLYQRAFPTTVENVPFSEVEYGPDKK